MLKRMRSKIGTTFLACAAWLAVSASYMPVFATNPPPSGGVTEATAAEVANKVVDVLNDVLMPIGGVVIFVTIVICAFKIITTANKPNERAEAMTSLPYIAFGGVLLGGALMAAGLIYGLMVQVHG